jgi:hypothetical protein
MICFSFLSFIVWVSVCCSVGFLPWYYTCTCIVLKSLSLPPLHLLTLSSVLCCLIVFSIFLCILFLYRCDVFHYSSLSFFPSFPPLLVSSTSPTFRYMFCIYFYVYKMLLVFMLGLYSTYGRKHVAFGFLNLTNFT